MKKTKLFPKLKRKMPWYIIPILLTVQGAISIILLFIVFYVINKEIIFWSIQVSWITVVIASAIEIGRQERLRKKAESKIENQLKEKQVLLKEVYHRVKNNMQVIVSMLRIQKNFVKDKKAREFLTASKDRIQSMALVHEKLYRAEDLAHIDFSDYVKSLSEQLFRTYVINPDKIKLNTDIKFALLDINSAIPCGLIINELVSNALKYAFPDDMKGEINISLHTDEENNHVLTVSDNGIGFPGKIDFRNTKTFGLQLVNILVDQLHSTVELDREGGTSIKITFTKKD